MRRRIDNDSSGTSTGQDAIGTGLKHLPAIEKLLETENLRTLTDDVICDLEAELHELIIDVRNSSDHATTPSISSKQSLLQTLRTASIKLNLAWNQIESKGKTSRYYQYLLACKEYLEKSYEQYVKVMVESKHDQRQSYQTATRQSSREHFSPVTFLMRGKTYVRELNDAHDFLSQMYDLFDTIDELWPDQCHQAISKLRTICQHIQNTIALLNSSPELQNDISSLCHKLILKLYHLDKQARILISLIVPLRSLCQTKSKQLITMREEILCKIETFEQSYSDILQSMTLLFNKVGSSESQHTRPHGLMLVKTLQ